MPKPNDRNSGRLKVAERDISKTCIQYLELRGWHCIRQNMGPFGKGGVPDYVAIHYRRHVAMWLEMKAPSDRRKCRCASKKRGKCTVCLQAEFAELVRSQGGLVLRIADVSAFISWYESRFAWYESRFGVEGQMRLGGAQ